MRSGWEVLRALERHEPMAYAPPGRPSRPVRLRQGHIRARLFLRVTEGGVTRERILPLETIQNHPEDFRSRKILRLPNQEAQA